MNDIRRSLATLNDSKPRAKEEKRLREVPRLLSPEVKRTWKRGKG
jgi:hypothetical protein